MALDANDGRRLTMAITNQEPVGKAMDLLRAGLAPFVEREVQSISSIGSRT
jgi:hypothetical protein